MVKGLDAGTIYFNFRLDISITKFNYMDEFVYVTKHMTGRESKITIHSVRKNRISCLVESVCNIVLSLIAADLFSGYENIRYVGLYN